MTVMLNVTDYVEDLQFSSSGLFYCSIVNSSACLCYDDISRLAHSLLIK